MVDYVVAFDVDGILRSFRQDKDIIPNEFMRQMLVTFSKFKNVKVVVHSGQGAVYAGQVIRELGLGSYVKEIYTKGDIEPDICIDDQHEFALGKINLIYNERQREAAW